MKSEQIRKSLASAVTQGGKDRVNKKSIYRKNVALGWMPYDRRIRKGGGTGQCQFQYTGTYNNILNKATDLFVVFFQKGKTCIVFEIL